MRENEQSIIPTLYVEKEKPVLNVSDNTILGLELREEEIITAEEVYEVLIKTDDNLLGSMFYDRLLEVAINDCGSKKNAEKRGYLHCVASSNLNEIKVGDILDSSIEKAIKIIVADLKNPKANKEKLRKDYVEDFNKFNNLFANDKKYWKDLFKKIKR